VTSLRTTTTPIGAPDPSRRKLVLTLRWRSCSGVSTLAVHYLSFQDRLEHEIVELVEAAVAEEGLGIEASDRPLVRDGE
jgi:hypothetical protein